MPSAMRRPKTTRKEYEHAWYASPLALPEGKSGRMEVRHLTLAAGTTEPIVGMRQAFLRGISPVRCLLTEPLRIHQLVEHKKHGTQMWMSDRPEELNQIQELLYNVQPHGRVLVGGLGLGLLAGFVARMPEVSTVVVVERSRDVIRLCAERGRYTVVQSDIGQYLRTSLLRFDYYLLDTWIQTNEGAWWEQVLPLRRIIRNRWGKKPVIHCWAEDIMLGQIVQALTTKEPHWYMANLPVPMSLRTAKAFVRDIGLPSWEEKYGAQIDAAYRAQNAR